MFNRTHAQGSPSVTLEKGVPRLRPVRPPRYNGPLRSDRYGGRPGYILPTDAERKTAAILAALAFATLIAVCVALYLLNRSSRWDISSLPFSARSQLRSSSAALYDDSITPLPVPRVLDQEPSTLALTARDSSEKYLSYLPHSGFHNQRIALENALIISYILNRTLLIPPVLLGGPPLRYRPSINLQVDVALSSKVGLEHCAFVPEATYIPDECTDFWTHTHVPWDWLTELPSLTQKHGINILWRGDLTDVFLLSLRLTPSETYFLNDTDPYQFRFYDSQTDEKPLGARYNERINLPTLATLSRGHRLLQLGSLFGTTRIRLSDPNHIALRGDVRRAMVYANLDLLSIADGVRDSRELGGDWRYAAVHLRLGDGMFADVEMRTQNLRLVWWKLVRELGLGDEDAAKIELLVGDGKDVYLHPPPRVRDAAASRAPHPPPPLVDWTKDCQRIALHPLLNIPLFIATDKPSHHALSIFIRTFPCLYFLHNFKIEVAKLDNLSVPSAGDSRMLASGDAIRSLVSGRISLVPLLSPFLDAMVAAKARVVVGTPGSTFSHFVEDVLWRAYHNWDIVQRG